MCGNQRQNVSADNRAKSKILFRFGLANLLVCIILADITILAEILATGIDSDCAGMKFVLLMQNSCLVKYEEGPRAPNVRYL